MYEFAYHKVCASCTSSERTFATFTFLQSADLTGPLNLTENNGNQYRGAANKVVNLAALLFIYNGLRQPKINYDTSTIFQKYVNEVSLRNEY